MKGEYLVLDKLLEITASAAPIIGKYLYDTVKKWWNRRDSSKEAEKNETTIANLLKEVEELKNKLEEKERAEISAEDVRLVKEEALKVESLGNSMKDEVFSIKAMNAWIDNLDNKTLFDDAEGLAEIYTNMLRTAVDSSKEMGLKRRQRDYLLELITSLQVNLDEFLIWSKKAVLQPTPQNQGNLLNKKFTLSDTVLAAREALREL